MVAGAVARRVTASALAVGLMASVACRATALGGGTGDVERSTASVPGGAAGATTGWVAQGGRGLPGVGKLQDPALRVGRLPNGLSYYVRANGVPANRAFLWLVVKAGSVHEEEDQRGYAHFLEHMAFNGTARFPRHEIIEFIESSGMRFGADLNAHTGFEETVYKLTVPTDDPWYLDRGLQVLEDWAGGGITLDSLEVVAERGVVLGEWRLRALRDTAQERIANRILDVLYGESRYRDRLPIGLPELLERADPAPLRRFYEAWYRPERMAVIAVGDFDAEWMEREIRERFGGLVAVGESPSEVEVSLPAGGEPVIEILKEDGVGIGVQLFLPVPERPGEAVSALRQELVSQLLLQHVRGRLVRLREQSPRPFIDAQVGPGQLVRPGDVLLAVLAATPDSLERGLGALLTELERVAQHGVPAGALEREKTRLLRSLESQAVGEAARSSAVYVEEYARHFLEGGAGALLSAEQRLELGREVLAEVTAEEVAEAARRWRELEGLRVVFYLPRITLGFAPPTRESVLALVDSIRRTPLAALEEEAAAGEGPLLERLPEPGRVVGEVVHAASGVVEWRLSNGARVLFKPSANHPDEVFIRAWSPGGFSLVPDSLFFTSGRMAAVIMTEAAGLGEGERSGLFEALGPRTSLRSLRVEIGYAEESIEVSGSVRELETLFQLLYVQFTAPRLDSAALETWARLAKYRRPRSVEHDGLAQYLGRSNPRLRPITTHLAELARLEEVLAVHRDRFGNAADFTFMVVGAATVEEVKPLVERYVASLPATGEREEPKGLGTLRLAGENRSRRDVFDVPRAQTVIVFDGEFGASGEAYFAERQRLEALTLVLERRLRNRLREELSGTYGVSVVGQTYELSGERFRVQIGFDAAPERNMELRREMLAVLEGVREEGASEEELERVVRHQRRLLETRLESNRYWLEQLTLYTRLGLPLERVVSPYPLSRITPEELKEAAARYLPSDAYYLFSYMPKREVMEAYEARRRGGGEAGGLRATIVSGSGRVPAHRGSR